MTRCDSRYVLVVAGGGSSTLRCEKEKDHDHRHQFVYKMWTDEEAEK